MRKVIWLLFLFLVNQKAFTQSQKKAELSLVDAEIILTRNRQYCDSILLQKGYYISDKDSVITKNGLQTYTYRNRKDFIIKITTKADSLKIINWDEPINTIHLLFKEAELLDYKFSEANPSIFDNKYRMNILVFVPQINRIKNTNSVLLAKRK